MTDTKACNEDKVLKIKNDLLNNRYKQDINTFLKVMSDETRFSIINILMIEECCVSDIAVIMDITKSRTSHQLRVLKDNRIIKSRREGKHVYYSIDDEHVSDVIEIIETHLKEKI